jgi:hypothetical protein
VKKIRIYLKKLRNQVIRENRREFKIKLRKKYRKILFQILLRKPRVLLHGWKEIFKIWIWEMVKKKTRIFWMKRYFLKNLKNRKKIGKSKNNYILILEIIIKK